MATRALPSDITVKSHDPPARIKEVSMQFHQIDPGLDPRNPGLWRSDYPHPSQAAQACTNLYILNSGTRLLCDRAHRPDHWDPWPIAMHAEDAADLIVFKDSSAVLRMPFDRDRDQVLPIVFHLTPPPCAGARRRFSFAPVFDATHDPIFDLPPLGIARLNRDVTRTVTDMIDTGSSDPDCQDQASRIRMAIGRWSELSSQLPDIRDPEQVPEAPLRGWDAETGRHYDWPAALPCRGLTRAQMDVMHEFLNDLLAHLLDEAPHLDILGLHLEPALIHQNRINAPSLRTVSLDLQGGTRTTADVDTYRHLDTICADLLARCTPVDLSRLAATDDPCALRGTERQDCTLRLHLTREAVNNLSAHTRMRVHSRFSANYPTRNKETS